MFANRTNGIDPTPGFFIIGAPKCGTTSLAAWLGEHPNVYVTPIKEPRYFSSDIGNQRTRTREEYTRLFCGVRPEHKAIGEASTTYLFSKNAVQRIEDFNPRARYIVMLRNPVDMAYSLHEQHIRSGNEDIDDFQEAWRLSEERREGLMTPDGCMDSTLLDYKSWCLLGQQLKRIYEIVSRERVLVLLLDDMKVNPGVEYRRVLSFLGVPDDERKQFPIYNPAREWRTKWLGRTTRHLARSVAWAKHISHILPNRSFGLVSSLQKVNSKQRRRPELSQDLRRELEDFFYDDTLLLEQVIGRQLPHCNVGRDTKSLSSK